MVTGRGRRGGRRGVDVEVETVLVVYPGPVAACELRAPAAVGGGLADTAPAGRRTKWLILVFWLVLVVLAGPLSGKLTGAEKNDTSSWLPSNAQSTQVLDLRSKVVSPNVYPAVLVYDRPSGITAADKAKATADAAKIAVLPHVVHGTVTGPVTVARSRRAP